MAREVWCNETAAFDEGGALSVISVMSMVQSNLQRSVASKRDSVGSDELRTLIDLTISRHHCAIRYKTKTTVTLQMLFVDLSNVYFMMCILCSQSSKLTLQITTIPTESLARVKRNKPKGN